eukprot:TRINITY_DN32818_c0_g1_i1.p1 TRINITY_DN32818_c0_g1~~TRINITY_DN32818_c0_g1_i1.p1  ORF type:complete len:150 (-),score=7.14 TRINITY_DN32818_c0_g1_i1:94-543(-)
MWTKPPPEVSCVSSSVESFYRGAVAGGVFGIVFHPAEAKGVVARLGGPLRPALLAGSWCFLTSFASCVFSRGGMPFPWNGAFSGLFSGAFIGVMCRWPPDSILWTMGASGALSVLSHYATEGQKEGVMAEMKKHVRFSESKSACNKPLE